MIRTEYDKLMKESATTMLLLLRFIGGLKFVVRCFGHFLYSLNSLASKCMLFVSLLGTSTWYGMCPSSSVYYQLNQCYVYNK